ncbi:MAG: hypothetical protein PWP54_1333 [Thermosipho sp. (in: thermotogales)]|nr:hypothetical protein [Thermosipho sp. (in: thermotogales)]
MSILKKLTKDIIFWLILAIYIFTYFLFNKTGIFYFKIIGSLSIGALVGYLTNILAIWMLFNPKRKILGIQGVIPKKRQEIAEGISTVIEEEFINPSSIKDFIEKNLDMFISSLEDFIENHNEIVIPSIKSIVGENYNKIVNLLAKNIYSYLLNIEYEKYSSSIIKKIILNNKFTFEIWEKLKNKSFKDLGIDLKEILLKNIEKTINSSKFNVIIKEKLTNLISEKVKIPFISIENFISGLLDNFLEDVVRDFNSKGATYYEIQNFIELHLSNLKIGDVVTFEQFDKFIHNFIERVEISKIVNYLKEKFDDQEFEKIIYILLDKLLCKEINISKILETFSIDLKVILKFLIVKYQRQIIDSIESFLKKISFSKIVKEKIESYSVEEMEEVTLKVAKKELRYVEIFGIPLGMLISLFQLIF